MNLRISQNALRFRISRDELGQLLEGTVLAEIVLLPLGHRYAFAISAVKEENVGLSMEGDRLRLHVPRLQLAALSQRLPSREGISGEWLGQNGETLALTLEVDVRRMLAAAKS